MSDIAIEYYSMNRINQKRSDDYLKGKKTYITVANGH